MAGVVMEKMFFYVAEKSTFLIHYSFCECLIVEVCFYNPGLITFQFTVLLPVSTPAPDSHTGISNKASHIVGKLMKFMEVRHDDDVISPD